MTSWTHRNRPYVPDVSPFDVKTEYVTHRRARPFPVIYYGNGTPGRGLIETGAHSALRPQTSPTVEIATPYGHVCRIPSDLIGSTPSAKPLVPKTGISPRQLAQMAPGLAQEFRPPTAQSGGAHTTRTDLSPKPEGLIDLGLYTDSGRSLWTHAAQKRVGTAPSGLKRSNEPAAQIPHNGLYASFNARQTTYRGDHCAVPFKKPLYRNHSYVRTSTHTVLPRGGGF